MIVQQLINGLSLGSIYALIALGYTLVYGTLRFINFAHGDVFMLGAFFGFYFILHHIFTSKYILKFNNFLIKEREKERKK